MLKKLIKVKLQNITNPQKSLNTSRPQMKARWEFFFQIPSFRAMMTQLWK
jgi:hypothetical protein